MTHQEFIEKVAKLVIKYASSYEIKVHSPIIAQAILESDWGNSKLASQYHNYFGLKCGSKWTGKSVNLTTKEEYTVGTITTIKDNFRVYGSMEEGIKGYFEFIQLPRYANLKGITQPRAYLETLKEDGYATDSSYVAKNINLIYQYNLTRYDRESEGTMTENDIKICGHGSGTPSIKNLYDYNAMRHNQTASNGKTNGLVCVKRLKSLTDTQRTEFVRNYNTILGRNAYNQALRQYVYKAYNGKYYSDCSSSGMATYEKVGAYTGPYLNTEGIYKSSLFETVPVNIVDGHITNPEILKVGDALLYRGNDSSRPLQIGHVEFVHTMPSTDKYTVGWHQNEKGWWYADTGNTYLASTWKIINHHWYYFDDEGYAVKGDQTINGELYKFADSGDYECALMHTTDRGVQVIWYVN